MTACGKFVEGYYTPDRNDPEKERFVELRTAYPCAVELGAGQSAHAGPCATNEQPNTLTARQRWIEKDRRKQADKRHAESGLGQFHARPQTFAEHLGEGEEVGIPHPSQEVPCPLCLPDVKVYDLGNHLRAEHGAQAPVAASSSSFPRRENPIGEIKFAPAPNFKVDIAKESNSLTWMKCTLHNESFPSNEYQNHCDEKHDGQYITIQKVDPPTKDPATSGRKGDQPLPKHNHRKVVHEELIEMVQERLETGIQRYGTGLQPMNGRDAAQDLVEEMLDGAVYAIQLRREREEMLINALVIRNNIGALAETAPDTHRQLVSISQALVDWLSIGS